MQALTALTPVRDFVLDTFWPARKVLAGLRAAWGKPGDKRAWLESEYFDLLRERSAEGLVDDRTWLDLEYPDIFRDMDTTLTPIGSQWLYHRLRCRRSTDDERDERYRTFQILRENAPLRERLQLHLKTAEDDGYANVATFLLDEPPEQMRHRGLISLWGLASLAVLGAVVMLGWPLLLWLAMVGVNFVVIFNASRHLHRDVYTLQQCLQMMRVASRVAAAGRRGDDLPVLRRLREESVNRDRVGRALSWFVFMQSPLISWIRVWLNLMFLLETSLYNLSIGRFLRLREALVPTFELLGEIDASIAIASFIERHPDHVRPTWTSSLTLELDAARHPLLADPVPNSAALTERSALITGSNMAGKTTFIKTVGINLLFAQTLGFCLAQRACLPRARVMTSIRGVHSVASGKSHYFAEIEAIRSFIELAAEQEPAVFLIDELFNGTNTVERVAAARAVLECLSHGAMVLVTTHDVELQTLMPERFVLFHFQENPDVAGFFDYRLRNGKATERNAIRLLERMGFPDRVVADAMTYAEST